MPRRAQTAAAADYDDVYGEPVYPDEVVNDDAAGLPFAKTKTKSPRKPRVVDHGRAWERQLEVIHDGYRRDQRAAVWKTNPPVKVLSPIVEGKFRAAWESFGPPDFLGMTRGVPLGFEAKSIEVDKFPCANLPRHQAVDLEGIRTNGGQAFIALRAADGIGWVIPWLIFGPLWWAWHENAKPRAVRASFAPAEIGIRMPSPGDWLPVLAVIP